MTSQKKSLNDVSEDCPASDSLSVPQDTLLGCSDLTKLPLLYPQTVLECIRERFQENEFYTWAGPTLVAVNPCKEFPFLYDESQLLCYHRAVQSGCGGLMPHVYAVAGVAEHRRSCDLGLINQAVVVSGESGAGKTESARYMLDYLCHVEDSKAVRGGGHSDGVTRRTQNKVLASNPLLEAFGNAATLRNHNSSRFGKLLRLQYGGAQLRGAAIDTYLLEKTRVTHQPHGERNFHIFHQVVAGLQSGRLDMLGRRVTSPAASASCPRFSICHTTSERDVAGLEDTLAALDELGFSSQQQDNILAVLVAVLHMSNISFTEASASSGGFTVAESCCESVDSASALLGVSKEDLCSALTVRCIAVPTKDKVSVFRHACERVEECQERASACMQLLYHSLFQHLIQLVNAQIAAAPGHCWTHFIGLLDVYGFESFEHNSLEQLCINYANERLQQAFTQSFLRTEQQVLLEEGVLVDEHNFQDNSGCVEALHSPVSVFAVLNEECQLHRAVDEVAACERVCRALQHSEYVQSPSTKRDRSASTGGIVSEGFVVRHYAGPVLYSPHALLTKNKDLVPAEVVALLAQSSDAFVSAFIEQHAAAATDDGAFTCSTPDLKGGSKWSSSPSLQSYTRDQLPYGTGSLRRPSTPVQKQAPAFQWPATSLQTSSPSRGGSLRRSARKVTTLSKFKSSLDSLLRTLTLCDLHFVRCIKPNRASQPGEACDEYLLSQLAACGVLDTVAISRAGYPVRMLFRDFMQRYGDVTAGETAIEVKACLLQHLTLSYDQQPDQLYRVGKRRVFLSEVGFHQLETVRERKRSAAACIIQANWKRVRCVQDYRQLQRAVATVSRCALTWRCRHRFLRWRRAAVQLQSSVRMWRARTRYRETRKKVLLLQSLARRFLALRRVRAMRASRVCKSNSDQSLASSLTSFGYQTASISSYSLESPGTCLPSSLPNRSGTVSPSSAFDPILMSDISTRSHLRSPEAPATAGVYVSQTAFIARQCGRRSILETEESGIETDTESLSGQKELADNDEQSRIRKKRAQLHLFAAPGSAVQEISQVDSRNPCMASQGSALDATPANVDGTPSISDAESRHGVSRLKFDSKRKSHFEIETDDPASNVTIRRKKRKSAPSSNNENVVRITNAQQMKSALLMFSSKPQMQFVLARGKREFFFKDGIVSCRRMPTVAVRFHTRVTCLPFSHCSPRALQPQGLLDALL
ncbi:Myosin head motor domain [Trinorchestia longiramus]|nr:Myosin head motor domain [Trinorchestia longiramus]